MDARLEAGYDVEKVASQAAINLFVGLARPFREGRKRIVGFFRRRLGERRASFGSSGRAGAVHVGTLTGRVSTFNLRLYSYLTIFLIKTISPFTSSAEGRSHEAS